MQDCKRSCQITKNEGFQFQIRTHCTTVAQNDGGKINRHFQAMNENATMKFVCHASQSCKEQDNL